MSKRGTGDLPPTGARPRFTPKGGEAALRELKTISLTPLLFMLLSLLLTACSLDSKATEPRWMVLVTTQELAESGLLDVLLPPFEQSNGVRIKRLALTTAKALDYAALAGVDVLLLPAGPGFDKLAGPPPTVPPFQSQPYPTPTISSGLKPLPSPQPSAYLFAERQLALWSEMILVAPVGDPWKLRESSVDVVSALKLLALNDVRFYSPRPEAEPGLSLTEGRLWNLIGRGDLKDRGNGYRQIEGDLNTVLRQAATDQAYTLTTKAAWGLSQNGAVKGKLEIAFTNDAALFLAYEVAIPANVPTQDRDLNLARAFVEYLTNQQAQSTIAQYKKEANASLFQPNYRSVYLPPAPKK